MTHGKSLSLSTATKKLTKERAAPFTAPRKKHGVPAIYLENKAAAELAKNAQTVLTENPLFAR